ncbi:S24 family peptidase [Paradevosia shaoguanensis]|uniref:S24 family peptidase n=1 Tax=Paradevosia shaoguanensis TaxID=1335043 RepID=UPI0019341859|nr:S24 family peptidase [Paradevosia shaoguanensis]
MADQRDEIREWLHAELERAGYGAKSKLARFLNVRPDTITRMLAEEPGKEAREIKAHELLLMGKFFNAMPPGEIYAPEELGESTATPSKNGLVPVTSAGVVSAGTWREVDDLDQSERETFWEPSDPNFPNARVLSFDVRGDSMNALRPRPILDGDRVIGLAYDDVANRVPLRDGMVVVVQRTREGGHIIEWSVKQIEFYKDRIEFHPRSTNPRHKPIVVPHDPDADNGTTVNILAWVRRITNELP